MSKGPSPQEQRHREGGVGAMGNLEGFHAGLQVKAVEGLDGNAQLPQAASFQVLFFLKALSD